MNEIETRKLRSGVKAIKPVSKRTYKRQKLDESIPIKLVLEESFNSSNEIFGEEEVAVDKVVNEAVAMEEEVEVKEEKKRKRNVYEPIRKYRTETEADLYISSTNSKCTFKVTHHHDVWCTLYACLCRDQRHKMKLKRMKCICGCTLVYIIRSCVHVAKNQYFIWTSGEHLNNEVNPDSKTQQFGVTVFIQKLFKECYAAKSFCTTFLGLCFILELSWT